MFKIGIVALTAFTVAVSEPEPLLFNGISNLFGSGANSQTVAAAANSLGIMMQTVSNFKCLRHSDCPSSSNTKACNAVNSATYANNGALSCSGTGTGNSAEQCIVCYDENVDDANYYHLKPVACNKEQGGACS